MNEITEQGLPSQMSLMSMESISVLENLVGTNFFMIGLADFFKGIIQVDNLLILTYKNRKHPTLEYTEPLDGGRISRVGKFLDEAYLLDPYYLAILEHGKQGFFHLMELASEDFFESDYYRTFYRHTGNIDECGYLFRFDDTNTFMNLSLMRTNRSGAFSGRELSDLAEITPCISNLITQHWLYKAVPKYHQWAIRDHWDLRNQFGRAIDCLGGIILTSREKQIISLILRGLSNKSISDRLNIALETVKVHRKNSYLKLRIKTQGELFYLFLNAIMSLEDNDSGFQGQGRRGGDPRRRHDRRTHKPLAGSPEHDDGMETRSADGSEGRFRERFAQRA